ncbi:MAG: S-layer homology domain-containing protein, partial [Oscillospiraceae bacterium]|nr:S-layer homology domain-containing protein [Oscillospiraceae bacterium]
IALEKTNGQPIEAPAGIQTSYEVAKNTDVTVYAPHVPGYVLSGVQSKTYPDIDTDQTATFTYKPIEDVVDLYTVPVTVRGVVEGTGSVLYSYIVYKPKNSGAYVVNAFDVNGFQLKTARTATLTIVEEALTQTFEYKYTGKRRPPVSDKVKELLETEKHIQYIYGYEDGTVRPNGNITRAEIAMIFWRLLKTPDKYRAVSDTFSDVENNAWYTQAVKYLAHIDAIVGYPDGSYKPGSPITRAEFVTICGQFDDLAVASENPFTDLKSSHWAYSYILSAYSKEWLTGYPNGTFKPDEYITRGEVVTILNRVLGRALYAEDVPNELLNRFPDLPTSHWAFADVIEASVAHEYTRRLDDYETWVSWKK